MKYSKELKLISKLADIATFNASDAMANKAMKILRSTNKTWHWCPDWDDLAICDVMMEFKYCNCIKE